MQGGTDKRWQREASGERVVDVNPMYKNIDGCRACGATDLVDILAFGDMPLANSLLSEQQLRVKEPHFPLTVVFCPACSLVQIRETVARGDPVSGRLSLLFVRVRCMGEPLP